MRSAGEVELLRRVLSSNMSCGGKKHCKLSHLDLLNMSRIWTYTGISSLYMYSFISLGCCGRDQSVRKALVIDADVSSYHWRRISPYSYLGDAYLSHPFHYINWPVYPSDLHSNAFYSTLLAPIQARDFSVLRRLSTVFRIAFRPRSCRYRPHRFDYALEGCRLKSKHYANPVLDYSLLLQPVS